MASTTELIIAGRSMAARAFDGWDTPEDEAAWDAEMAALTPHVAEKLVARRHVAAALREQQAGLRLVSDALASRAARLGTEADRVDDGTLALMTAHVEAGGGDKIATPDGGWCRRAVRKSQAIDVTCEPTALPVQYQRVKVEADKTALKVALVAGVLAEGVELVDRESVGLAWSR